MDLNIAMQFVAIRAQAEAALAGKKGMHPEHLFLGVLKVAEVKAEEIAPSSDRKEQTNEDIKRVAGLLQKAGIDSRKGRAKLRRVLQEATLPGDGESAVVAVLSKAFALAADGVVSATGVLSVLLDEPTPILKSVFHIGELKEEKSPPQVAPPAENPEGKSFLPELTGRIRNMRYALLEKVHGQDHAVHAFAEGMFSAEVLAAADETRKRPRAIFVFAGPPGVGKTFLAEQAAEALSIPFKRFDMSSYADHQAHTNLIGFAPSYKDAKAGQLSGFVKDHPHCILLFDEIEKAHLNTIQLFLQILDAGTLHDDFLDETVAFKDTVIIFTTNAGRQLYEGDYESNAAGIPRQTLLNALETDTHPQTGRPFFPSAICSRLATGYPMMFNHLRAYDLEKISAGEFLRLCRLFEKQYNIKVSADALLSGVLLFAEGGHTDARTLRAQTELFFKNEIFKLCRLWDEGLETALEKLESIHIETPVEQLPAEVKLLFENPDSPEIVFFGDAKFAAKLREQMPGVVIHDTRNTEEALNVMGERNILFVLMELFATPGAAVDLMATRRALNEALQRTGTLYAFDNVPLAAMLLYASRQFFNTVRQRLPDMPVYLLESDKLRIDNELQTAFVRAGAKGKLIWPQGDPGVLVEELTAICSRAYLQHAATGLAAQHKVISFETAPILSEDKTHVTIRLRELSIHRAVFAGDSGEVLDDVEKPNERFDDVIGATAAKEELQFFLHYLKNPGKALALGHKPPKGVLLYGPSGTGKTLLARAMAGESEVAFIPAVASAFVTKYQGSGPEAVRALFKRARRYAPSIVFIDEIDAIGRARGGRDTGHGEEMALNALLTEMDGFAVDPKRPVFVLAATNFEAEESKSGMGAIDAALARRFDRRILVDLPNREDRLLYLQKMLGKRKNSQVTEKMMQRLAARSTGLSLANLESVLELASRMAAKKNLPLGDDLLEEAFEINRHGEKKDWGHEYLERVARHESGHAYLCFLAGKTPAYLTIVARGEHGGYMEHADDEGSPLKTKEELLGRIRTSLGGRAAEIVYYGEEDGISTGASGDLQSATRIARAMICAYGMDYVVGMVALSEEEATKGPLAEQITRRIAEIIKNELAHSIRLIFQGKPVIDRLVEQLLEKNKLTKDEMECILKS
jgi:ATP-dependent metalloprotease FtsH